MRLSNATRSRWSRSKTALAAIVLAAIPVLCAHELYSAVTEGGVNSFRGQRWIAYADNPIWFIVCVAVYSFYVLFGMVFAVLAMVGWRNDRLAKLRNRSKPVFDDAIRLDPDSR
jgi:hypothetical protein